MRGTFPMLVWLDAVAAEAASDTVSTFSIGGECVYLRAPYLRHVVRVPLSQ